jgi:hypothetical protein
MLHLVELSQRRRLEDKKKENEVDKRHLQNGYVW